MSVIGENIKNLIRDQQTSQEEVARKAGISQVALHKIIVGKTKRTGALVDIAKALGVSAEELSRPMNVMKHTRQIGGNMPISPIIPTKRPLISYTQAGEWGEAVDPYQVNDAEDWLDAPEGTDENAFYLKVEGISMLPDYPPGGFILVQPSVRAEHDDDVVFRNSEGAVTFKCLQITPDGKHLLARNPDYRPRIVEIPPDSVIVGVVTDYTRKVGRFRK